MAKNHSIAQAKYDSTHCKYYSLKMNLENDADVIARLAEVESMQGYIKQLIRDDITRTCPGSVPVPLSSAAVSMLEEKVHETGRSIPELISLIVNDYLIHT